MSDTLTVVSQTIFSTKSYMFINPTYMYFRELYSVTEATGFLQKYLYF
jgi:hypothetical protein